MHEELCWLLARPITSGLHHTVRDRTATISYTTKDQSTVVNYQGGAKNIKGFKDLHREVFSI